LSSAVRSCLSLLQKTIPGSEYPFRAVSDSPSISTRNLYSHRLGILIHITPERLFTCPGIRSVSEATIYTWKAKYGGLEVSEAQRLRQLEEENRRLKHLVADLSLDKEVLKAVISKNGWGSQLNGKM
jgi:putative transposase